MIDLGMLPKNFPNSVCQVKEEEAPSVPEKTVNNKELPLDDSLEKIYEDFKNVITDKLSTRRMNGPPMRIHVEGDCKPLWVTKTRQIMRHWQDEADELVSKLLSHF